MRDQPLLKILLLAVSLSACGDKATVPLSAGTGPRPVLPPPKESLIPTLNIAPAKGWPEGGTPIAATGTQVTAFADGLEHPRWLYVLPNGDVLVAESDTPEKKGGGIKARVMRWFMRVAGSGLGSADRISLLRDTDQDGIADQRSVFLQGLKSPIGMALVGDQFYVAATDALLRFPYQSGQTQISASAIKVLDLPAGPINHHWTKNLLASPDGRKLYVTVGSNSNVGENGLENEEGRATIWEVDRATGRHRIYASGLRNPNGLAWEPESGVLWTAVNERDEIGSDLVPDYITAVQDGAFYGWPFSYFGQILDTRVLPQRLDLVAKALVPDYALGAHSAALGIGFANDSSLPAPFQRGLFVALHGSWNRKPHSGYKVIFVPFRDGQPRGEPLDLLTGFLSENGKALGRPVAVINDRQGALLVTDDVGNIVWRVTPRTTASADSELAGSTP